MAAPSTRAPDADPAGCIGRVPKSDVIDVNMARNTPVVRKKSPTIPTGSTILPPETAKRTAPKARIPDAAMSARAFITRLADGAAGVASATPPEVRRTTTGGEDMRATVWSLPPALLSRASRARSAALSCSPWGEEPAADRLVLTTGIVLSASSSGAGVKGRRPMPLVAGEEAPVSPAGGTAGTISRSSSSAPGWGRGINSRLPHWRQVALLIGLVSRALGTL